MEETMKQRRLGKNGPDGCGDRARLHGHALRLRPTQRCGIYCVRSETFLVGNQRCWAEHGRRIGANERLNGDTSSYESKIFLAGASGRLIGRRLGPLLSDGQIAALDQITAPPSLYPNWFNTNMVDDKHKEIFGTNRAEPF